ncbi:MAG: peptide chain release factor 1, partial [Methanomassiliicoccaceae archaeon]|nr:peptide chain release factor 1 [Methanomassiliicoccaceae archaeon]
GLRELVDAAKDALTDIQLTIEKEYMQRFFREIRKQDGGLSAYGEDDVRTAVNAGAVDVLLLSESLNKYMVTAECGSGHTVKTTVDNPDERIQCPECGQPAKVVEQQDLIDNFFEAADGFNTKVQLISGDSEEGDMLLKAFGGMAAILRYRMG